jgi:formylglycine-generating enzyme required for sulfatase activity
MPILYSLPSIRYPPSFIFLETFMLAPHYLKNIRQLVSEVYNAEELRQLCYEEFRPVYEDYADRPESELVRHLIDYCERKGQLAHLLALVQAEAPARYAEYEGQLLPPEEPPRLILTVVADPATINLGDKATWTVTIHNDSDQILRNVIIQHGRTLVDDPFDLIAGEKRQLIFRSAHRTIGKKRKKVQATALTNEGYNVQAEATATVEVQTPPLRVTEGIEQKSVSVYAETLTLTEPLRITLVHIPAGEFLMGSNPARDKKARANEQPQHPVYLSDFYINKHPITNSQYAAFVKATDYQAHEKWGDKGLWFLSGVQFPWGDKHHPAIYVSWRDAVAFCQWLSQESGHNFRLPSEAEWEKAARGSEGLIYPWGNDWDYTRLNTLYNGPNHPTPVGQYSPQGDSPYGLTDMAGNVWEWCADWFEETLYTTRYASTVERRISWRERIRRATTRKRAGGIAGRCSGRTTKRCSG